MPVFCVYPRPVGPFFLPLLVGLLLAVGGLPHRAGAAYIPLPRPGEAPVALLTSPRATYLVTTGGVYRRQGRRLALCYRAPADLRCAVATDSALWLGTARGVVVLNTRTLASRAQPLPAGAATAGVTALCRDAHGGIWAGATGYGAFRWQLGGWVSQLSIPALNAGATTPDSAVWLATNIGLYRWQRQQWTRYNEEGVANHEIPDNIVERLLPDNEGSLWVFMADGISVLARHADSADLPTVRYLGRPGNAVFSVLHLPRLGYVFATALGLLLLPEQPAGPLPGAAADQVQTPQLLRPIRLPGLPNPGLIQADHRGRVWVATENGVQRFGAGQFRRLSAAR